MRTLAKTRTLAFIYARVTVIISFFMSSQQNGVLHSVKVRVTTVGTRRSAPLGPVRLRGQRPRNSGPAAASHPSTHSRADVLHVLHFLRAPHYARFDGLYDALADDHTPAAAAPAAVHGHRRSCDPSCVQHHRSTSATASPTACPKSARSRARTSTFGSQ